MAAVRTHPFKAHQFRVGASTETAASFYLFLSFIVRVAGQTAVHAHEEARQGHQMCSVTLSLILSRQGLSLNLDGSDLARLAGQKSPSIPPSPGVTSAYSHVHFYVGMEIRTQVPQLAQQVLAWPLHQC